MYTLIRAYGVRTAYESKWEDIPAIDALPMNQIFSLYRKVFLHLTNSFVPDPVYLDMDELKTKFGNTTDTLAQVLAANGNMLWPSLTEMPVYKTVSAQYLDAFRANYNIERVAKGAMVQNLVHDSEKVDLKVWRNNTDMEHWYKHCLVTVNGMFHQTDTDRYTGYVLDGGRTVKRSRTNLMGLWSFEHIGQITQVPITKDMVYSLENKDLYSRRAYFDLSGYDTVGKTVMAVIGGYLYLPINGALRQYGDNSWMVDFSKVPLMDRLVDSSKYLDFSGLGLTPYEHNNSQVSVEEFRDNQVFSNYLTMSQSFFIIIDAAPIFVQKHMIQNEPLHGQFLAAREPVYPLFGPNGRSLDYWKAYEEDKWAVFVDDSMWYNRHHSKTSKANLSHVTDQLLPPNMYHDSKAYFLEIAADVKQ